MSADMFIHCVKEQVIVDDKDIGLPCAPYNNAFSANEYADHVKIIFTYETITIPKTLVEVSYQINSNGEILVENLFHGRPELPELPVFGLRILMPTLAKEYRYEGLSGETYPDRKKGAHRGVFIEKPIMTPYLVPQECGMHMDTEWVEIYRDTIQDNSVKESRGKP